MSERPNIAVIGSGFGPRPGEETPTKQGVKQTTCIMCGECNIGCNCHAKNTLGLNYLARAAKYGAIIRPSAEVRAILPKADNSGYTVVYSDPRNRSGMERLEATYVIVAAGSLGSAKLLLRMKHSGQLPALSPALGTRGRAMTICSVSASTVWPPYIRTPARSSLERFISSTAAIPMDFPMGSILKMRACRTWSPGTSLP
jgi:hypothetical protein